ncbi:DUF1302 family protein [Stenotrophobium rhamnosiphilum]|uniref:DUF1302 domain-containing protein n=1 Tax=Stenotrophobium rhamnosiphilum TaxID=2029166 RepID=A0A2T5MJK4_9GAMM|nr:DUF1302 family protein [Stenotrophobium rhamnosiphilum]PTU32766.1 hypothetical protein CJD38_01200 [Stenotrophobium rhamnosiphilum]
MKQTRKSRRWIYSSAGLLALTAASVFAQDDYSGTTTNAESDGKSSSFNISYSGSLRYDMSIATANENPFNQRGNLFNGVTVNRVSFDYPLGSPPTIFATPDPATRTGDPAHNAFNMQLLRADLRADIKFNENFNFVARLRAVADPGAYQEFEPGDVGSLAAGRMYGRPDYFHQDVEGKSRPNPLEWSNRIGMIDLPSLYFAYNKGPLLIKLGNQDIAWGQAIFFRVLDIPNGIDFRRHSILDYASEEFQDKRVPSLALRTSYQFDSGWLADGFVQKFQPTVLSNPNTPYNIIASQFTVHDRYGDYDNKLNYGLRFKGDIGKFGVQAVAARRYNPDGVFRWTESGVNRDIPGAPGSGGLLMQTPFEIDPTGVWTAKEWFTYAAMSRLDGVQGLNSAIDDFPAGTGPLGALNVGTDMPTASLELDTFFRLSGSGLRGHIEREYRAETNLGLGGSYVTQSSPGSWLDQLIINVEALYTPDRSFTNPSLGQKFLKQDELVTAVVLEKYQSIVKELPATYVVAQWMHRTRSDILGRSLEGQGGDTNNVPTGKNGYDAFVFALQQPFPNLVWRADLAVLYEPFAGGILVQPGVRWKPNGNLTIEGFYNYLNGSLNGNSNSSSVATFSSRDEFTMRVGYQF